MTLRCLALSLLVVSACADVGQDRVAVPLQVAGTAAPADGVVTTDGVTLQLTRADLAFGPLVLCAGATAGELCDTARVEWLDSVVVDALDPQPATVGSLNGVSGSVRSWMYDLGISSQLTDDDPFVLSAAESLDGMSVVIEGEAILDGLALPFRAALPIAQAGDAERGVPMVRKSSSEQFSHVITGAEASLTVRFDAAAWLGAMKLRPAIEEIQACLADARDDCASTLELFPDSAPYRALRNAIVAGARPDFVWAPTP